MSKSTHFFDGFTHLLTMLYAVIMRFDSLREIETSMTAAMDRAYINYEKFESLTERNVVYVTKMRRNLKYETLLDFMEMTPEGMMEYREKVVVFRKGEINHIARIVTYVDIKKGKHPQMISIKIQIWVTLIANLLLSILQCSLERHWSFSGLATMVRIVLMYYLNM